LQGANPFI